MQQQRCDDAAYVCQSAVRHGSGRDRAGWFEAAAQYVTHSDIQPGRKRNDHESSFPEYFANALIPTYAPSGTKIVYTINNKLWVMNADGTNPVNLDVVGEMRLESDRDHLGSRRPRLLPHPTPEIKADIDVDAQASVSNVTVGGQVRYTIVVKNLGGDQRDRSTLKQSVPGIADTC
jgi:predicted MPP superfamily phosphohydrolase